jgi:hypothetical protein
MMLYRTYQRLNNHGKAQKTAKTRKLWSTVKDETAAIQEENRIRHRTLK